MIGSATNPAAFYRVGMFFARFARVLTQTLPSFEGRTPQTMQRRVLLVEDERVTRRALTALLAASGYATESVESAEEALNLLSREETPDIALVDFNLPGMTGLELIERLEQLNPNVYPVLITAQGGDRFRALLRNRRLAYLQKPLNFDSLLALLSEHQTQ